MGFLCWESPLAEEHPICQPFPSSFAWLCCWEPTFHQTSVINATKCWCITISWREAKNSNSPWHAVSDHGPVETEEEHPLEHHHRPSVVKLIHRAFSGCKRTNSSRAPRKYNCSQKVRLETVTPAIFHAHNPYSGYDKPADLVNKFISSHHLLEVPMHQLKLLKSTLDGV